MIRASHIWFELDLEVLFPGYLVYKKYEATTKGVPGSPMSSLRCKVVNVGSLHPVTLSMRYPAIIEFFCQLQGFSGRTAY